MRSSLRIPPLPVWLTRIVAAGGVALVLFLATLAASPEIHARFHNAAVAGNDDGCAVGLFAGGVVLSSGPFQASAPDLAWQKPAASVAEKLFLVASRYLRQPERGPPLS